MWYVSGRIIAFESLQKLPRHEYQKKRREVGISQKKQVFFKRASCNLCCHRWNAHLRTYPKLVFYLIYRLLSGVQSRVEEWSTPYLPCNRWMGSPTCNCKKCDNKLTSKLCQVILSYHRQFEREYNNLKKGWTKKRWNKKELNKGLSAAQFFNVLWNCERMFHHINRIINLEL